jgi:dTMP kinase
MEGMFLAFEGIDGSGKRTVCSYTQTLLEEQGILVEKYEYPDYDSPWGKIINDFLSGSKELDVSTQFLTYATDIAKDQKEIINHLKEGYTVLADRYITSTVAFQCARGFDLQTAIQFVHLFKFVVPDIIFYMNVSPEKGRQRKKGQKGSLDRHESDIKFLEDVNTMYGRLCDRKFLAQNWIEIDANQELSQVKKIIRSEIASL